MKLTEPQDKMLRAAAASPNLRAGAGHRKERTLDKLVELGLGTKSFYGAPSFQINKAGLLHLGLAIGRVEEVDARSEGVADAMARVEAAAKVERDDPGNWTADPSVRFNEDRRVR